MNVESPSCLICDETIFPVQLRAGHYDRVEHQHRVHRRCQNVWEQSIYEEREIENMDEGVNPIVNRCSQCRDPLSSHLDDPDGMQQELLNRSNHIIGLQKLKKSLGSLILGQQDQIENLQQSLQESQRNIERTDQIENLQQSLQESQQNVERTELGLERYKRLYNAKVADLVRIRGCRQIAFTDRG